jgi:hypothetical protein
MIQGYLENGIFATQNKEHHACDKPTDFLPEIEADHIALMVDDAGQTIPCTCYNLFRRCIGALQGAFSVDTKFTATK